MYSLYAVRKKMSKRCFKTVALFMQSPYHLKHHRVFQYQRFIFLYLPFVLPKSFDTFTVIIYFLRIL